MSVDQIAAEALKLSVKDRALLASSLWDSLGDPYALSSDLDDEEAIQLSIQRDEDMETGRVQPLSHRQLMERLRQ